MLLFTSVLIPRSSEVSGQAISPILPPYYTFFDHTECFRAKGDPLKEETLQPKNLTTGCPPHCLCFRDAKAVITGKIFLLLQILLCSFP